MKGHLASVNSRLPYFTESKALTGANNNSHYEGQIAYQSVVTSETESIKVEISLREMVLLSSSSFAAKTLLIDPYTNASAIAPFEVQALSLIEAYAEKTRAALTRRDPAIRDFFDLDRAVRRGLLEHSSPDFLQLVAQNSRSPEILSTHHSNESKR
jgi:hypothetical protein